MNEIFSLDLVSCGAEVTVKALISKGSVRRRLLDLGVVPGTKMKVLRFAAFGDPVEISLRGYVLTLCPEEARNIIVEF